ncbi:hypothetical protein BKA63DRAFT_428648 [Paraphoma chrysanthemicola]|nr:hypothetical protein BKA63DRAFT_428648 [Paraphoma chrysanthemicola]
MDPAASAAGASTLAVITKTDAPFLTITPKPDAPLATGADKPTQTTLSSEQDGHSPGDLAIYLSDDLAGRINEMIVRSQQCDVGNGLTLGVKAVSAQDISEQISGIICAAKALVLNAFPGGPFADLAAIQAKQPAWSAPELVDALFAVVSFAIAQARYLKMTASDATTIAYISFYLAFINIRNKVPLGKTVAFEPWHVPHQAPFQLENKNPIGVCPPPPGNETDFPLDMFAPVYTKFCEQADKSKDTTMWTVGPDGGHVPAKRSLFRFPSRRADTSQYKDYKFTLASVKREDKKDCLTSCANAYRQLSLQDMCKRGNEKTAIANTGFLDAGCAAYSFSIEMPQVLIDVVCVRPISTVMAAPKFDKSANGAVSIESAARQWCGDRDGQNVDWNEGTKVFEQRWGMSIDDAPDRGEFKLRANLQPNNAVGKIVKSQCIQAFTDGLNACEISSDTTHGFVARLGSIEYTLDVSGELPRSADCSRGADPGRKIDDSDMQKALDAFCVDTRDIKPFGKNWEGTFYYPPSGQPAFYADQTYKMHLNFGAEEWEKS